MRGIETLYKKMLWMLPAAAIALSATAQETINMNFGWKFMPGAQPGAETVEYDAAGWQDVNLPHDFQISQPWMAPSADDKGDKSNEMANIASKLSSRAFKEMGEGWYRKTFTPDPSWKGNVCFSTSRASCLQVTSTLMANVSEALTTVISALRAT